MSTRRLSLIAILGGCALFGVLNLALRLSQPPIQVDLTQVPETDRWKHSPAGRAAKLAEVRAREQLLSTTYGWVNRESGIVRLPLDRALELTLQDLSSQKAR